MRECVNKICATLILIMITALYIMPNAVYAANIISEIVENNIPEEAFFDATIGNNHIAEAGINDEVAIGLDIKANSEGYLKNVKVAFEGANYYISRSADEINQVLLSTEEVTNANRIINSIDMQNNQIAFREVERGEDLKAIIPVKFNKQETVSKEDLEKESVVKLEAVYVNGKSEDKVIKKDIKLKLNWKVVAESEIKQKVIRNVKYNNKTMISFEIEEGIKEDKVPEISKELEIEIPRINGQLPEIKTVSGNEIEKVEQEEKIIVRKIEFTTEEGKYNWNTREKYIVTYIYNTQIENEKIKQVINKKSTTITGEEIQGRNEEEIEIGEDIGNIIELESEMPKEINKGYIYTNLNSPEEKLNTEYEQKHRVNIGYTELTDKIVLEDGLTKINNENDEEIVDATNNILITNVKVSDKAIDEVLGKDGRITVKNQEGEELGILNNSTRELKVEANRLIYEINNVEKEGNIEITEKRAILGDNSFEVDQMTEFKKMETELKIVGYSQETEITNVERKAETYFTEPETKASIDLNTDALSTITGNKDVEFNVTLHKTDISDMLYSNPIIKITVPEEVRELTLKSAKIVYDEELLIEKVEQEGREVTFYLTGTQTQYNKLATTKGTLLKIVADVSLDILAPSGESKIIMEYTNGFTNETKIAEKPISIIAPNQIITTNQIDIDDKSAFALDKDVNTISLKTRDEEKTMQVTGQIINNMGTKVEGVQIIGRMPSAGNKTIGGVELGSNIQTSLITPIEIAGFENAQVMYSSDINEELAGSGWQEQATSDSKSFKIVIPDGIENRAMGGFRYTVSIPANLDYEQVAKENYGLYYNNNAEEGVTQNLVESKVLGIETGKAPELKVNITAYDTNEGYEIKEGGDVREGQYITYKVEVKNTGTVDAKDVSTIIKLPEGLDLVEESTAYNSTKYITKKTEIRDFKKDIDVLEGNNNNTFTFRTQVSRRYIEKSTEEETEEIKKEREDANRITLNSETSADILDDSVISEFNINNSKGNLALLLTSDAGKYIMPKQSIKYNIKIDNISYEEKNNIKVVLHLPKGFTYKKIKGHNEQYDENQNELTVDIDYLSYRQSDIVEIECENVSDKEEELKIYATAYYDELVGDIKSNVETYINNVSKKTIKATQSINTTQNVNDKDTLEFYTNIENTSDIPQRIEYEDSIPTQLEIEEYSVIMDKEVISKGNSNYISEFITIPSNETVKIFVKAKCLPIENGDSISLENKPKIIVENGEEIDVEAINLEVEGTRILDTIDENVINETDESYKTNKEKSDNEGKFRISGNIWYDENRNGEKENNEQKISDIIIKLIDAKTNKIVKDKDGNEVTTKSNSLGEYSFKDVKNGKYFLQAEYDNRTYEIGQYKAEGIEESINSDFVGYSNSDKEYAVTDIIKISNDNAVCIDLALVRKERLDITVTQSISKVTVINDKNSIRSVDYNGTNAKLELESQEIKDSTVLVEYNIRATNYGDIAGYAKQIIETVPDGMKFVSEMNPNWYMGKDGYLYTISLADEMINQGESKDIKLVLVKKIDENGLGLIRGKAEFKTTYSEAGLKKIRAKSARFINSENEITMSDLIIVKKVNVKILSVIGITIGIFGLLVIIAYEIKQNVIDKIYNID